MQAKFTMPPKQKKRKSPLKNVSKKPPKNTALLLTMPSSEEDSWSDSLLTQHSQRFAGDDGNGREETTQATKPTQATQAFKQRRGHGTPRPSATVSRAKQTDEDKEEG